MAAPATCVHGGRTAAVHDGDRYCDWCSRNAAVFRRPCARCGRVDHLNVDRWCRGCRAADVIDTVFVDAVLRRQPALVAVRDHFREADPAYILPAKRRSNVWRLVEQIAAVDHVISHVDLDAMGSPRAVSQLRSLLVDLQVLPPRDDYAAVLAQVTRDLVASLPHREDQLALRRFVRWRQQRRRGSEALTLSMAANDRAELRVIHSLLTALNAQGRTIASASQAAVDAWAQQHRTAFRARRFLDWTSSLGVSTPLKPPASRPSGFHLGGQLGAGDAAALERALTDPTLPARMRLAVLLVTVYAVRVHRIAALRHDQLILRGCGAFFRLGDVDAHLPAHAASWIAAIHADVMSKPRAGGSTRHGGWVFPGYRHGTHMLPSSLLATLRQLGVTPTVAHRASAASLITQLPPAVVARLIGVDVRTTAGWHALSAATVEHR